MAANLELKPLASASDISKEWLEKVLGLKMSSTVSVLSWKERAPNIREGFLSEICFIRVTVNVGESTEEKALVIKFMPQEKERFEFVNIGNLHRREAQFYTIAGSEEFLRFCRLSGLDHPVPSVYWSCVEGNSMTLVLNDLNAENYRMFVPAEGNSIEQTKSVFESIAVIHAFGYTAVKKHGKEHFHIPFESSYIAGYVSQGLGMQVEIFSGSPISDIMSAMVPLSEKLSKISQDIPFIDSLVHGDLWAGNVMFSADDKKASIFDWQFALVDNPLCDITTMFLMSVDPVVYEEHLVEVMENYWNSFTCALKKNGFEVTVTFESLLDNLEKMWIYGFMFLTASLSDMMENNKLSEGRLRRIISFLEERNTFTTFLKSYKK